MLDKGECQKFITKLIKLVKDKKLAKAYDKKAFDENFETFDSDGNGELDTKELAIFIK